MLATSTIRSTSDPAIKLSYPRDRITIDVDGYPEWSLQGTTTYDLGTFTLNSTGASTVSGAKTIPPEGVFTPVEAFENLTIVPPGSYTAPEFNLNKRIQISVKRSFIIQTLNEVRKSIESRNNLVPFNLADLRILDRTAKEYTISRAIASNVDSGGGGGATETESWF